jgi:serine/threonine protein kinase
MFTLPMIDNRVVWKKHAIPVENGRLLAFSQDGSKIAVYDEHCVYIYTTFTLTLVTKISMAKPCRALAFTYNEFFIASGVVFVNQEHVMERTAFPRLKANPDFDIDLSDLDSDDAEKMYSSRETSGSRKGAYGEVFVHSRVDSGHKIVSKNSRFNVKGIEKDDYLKAVREVYYLKHFRHSSTVPYVKSAYRKRKEIKKTDETRHDAVPMTDRDDEDSLEKKDRPPAFEFASMHIFMEFIPWEEFREAELSELSLAKVLYNISAALVDLHTNYYTPLVHGDIKPQNIMVCRKSLTVKLIDFGLSVTQGVRAAPTTYVYQAPEKFNRYACAHVKNDMWAIGIMVYRHMFKKYPYIPEEERGLRYTPAFSSLADFARNIDTIVLPAGFHNDWKRVMKMCCCVDREKRVSSPEFCNYMISFIERIE